MTDTLSRRPSQPPPPRPRAPAAVVYEPTEIAPRWLAAGVLGAIAFDLGLRRPPYNNLAGTLMIVLFALALYTSGFTKTRTSRVMLILSVCFGAFLTVRSDPLLTLLNVVISGSLLVAAAIHGGGRSVWDWRPVRALVDASECVAAGVEACVRAQREIGARFRVAKAKEESPRSAAAAGVMRGLALALPVLVVLGLLLASADAVFEAFFTNFGFDIGRLIRHLVLLSLGAIAVMALLIVGKSGGADDVSWTVPTIGRIETAVVLIGMNVLFGIFALAQAFTIAGGAEDALERAGVDPKEFARQGFFQLLWVAGITLVVLMVLNAMQAGESATTRRVTRWLSSITIVLTLVIVWVAFTRIGFYIGEEGQTPLRFYSTAFSIWSAAAFVLVAARIWGVRARDAWLMPVLAVSVFVVVIVLNVINPERIMVEDNIAKNHEHLAYHVNDDFRQFSSDGQAVLANGLGRLSPELAQTVRSELCEAFNQGTYNDGPLHFNLGRRNANDALTNVCGPRG